MTNCHIECHTLTIKITNKLLYTYKNNLYEKIHTHYCTQNQ
jgi:hypothetical protein